MVQKTGSTSIPLKKGGQLIQDRSERIGVDINALAQGRVAFAGEKGGYGKLVIIDHGYTSDGKLIQTYYAHNDKINVTVGDWVMTGDTIAGMGNTGNSTGPHTHFGIRVGGEFVNPKGFQIGENIDPGRFMRFKYDK